MSQKKMRYDRILKENSRQRMQEFILEDGEEIILDFYEEIPDADGGRQEPQGFNIGWLLDNLPEDAKIKLSASTSSRARAKECPNLGCSYWFSNYCSCVSTYKKCEKYLNDTSAKQRKEHKEGFVIGVEVSAGKLY